MLCNITRRRQHQLPTAAIPIVGVPITPARSRPWSRHLHRRRLVDADARQRNSVAVIHCSPPVASDPPSGADSHVPDARCGSGMLVSRLRQCSTGRHSSLPRTPFAVGAQRGGMTHLPSVTVRPHLWFVGVTELAARPRMRAVQNRGANVQSTSR